ncbi:permease prefix domain 1-containing protein [Romboutsia sp.]|uniref:permease prefix domain 1-containing protein n=1 Tax=Romboutsia sp. TaxID=1965302 RepID=UPI003F3F7FA9
MNVKDTSSIESFLQSVCRFISTEEKAKEIQDELRDHICSCVEYYTKNGMSTSDATTMALKQMGDPSVLSKIYKDKTSNLNRFLLIFLTVIVLLISAISGIVSIYINSHNDLTLFYIYTIITLAITLYFGTYIVGVIKTYKKECEISKVDPLFYIQSYKSSIFEEKLIKYSQVACLIISSLIFIYIFIKFNHLQLSQVLLSSSQHLDWISCFVYLAIYLYILNPKDKHTIVYTDGLLSFNYFAHWSDIQGYMWSKELVNGNSLYTLEFAVKKSSKISGSRAPIKVSSSQVILLNELFEKNNVPQIYNS